LRNYFQSTFPCESLNKLTDVIGILWGRHGKLTPTLLIFTKVDSHTIFGQLSRRSIFLEGADFHLETTLEKNGDVKNVYE